MSCSATFLCHWIAALTETTTRLPPGAPLLSRREAPALKAAPGVLAARFLNEQRRALHRGFAHPGAEVDLRRVREALRRTRGAHQRRRPVERRHADARNDMRIAQEEIFGPVACLIPFSDEADAIRQANGIPYGLSSYVSHWPATPDSGKINAAWDREFLARWSRNDKAALLSYTDGECYRDGGQGAFEIRTFIAVAAAARGAGTVRHSQPIPIFAVSCTIGVMAIA